MVCFPRLCWHSMTLTRCCQGTDQDSMLDLKSIILIDKIPVRLIWGHINMRITYKSQATATSDTACGMLARGQPHALHEFTCSCINSAQAAWLHMCCCQSQCPSLSCKVRLAQVHTGAEAERKHFPAACNQSRARLSLESSITYGCSCS